MSKKWEIKFKNEKWSSNHQGEWKEGHGFYEILFEGTKYGFISAQSFDEMKTGEILPLVEQMLNDAYDLARGIKDAPV